MFAVSFVSAHSVLGKQKGEMQAPVLERAEVKRAGIRHSIDAI